MKCMFCGVWRTRKALPTHYNYRHTNDFFSVRRQKFVCPCGAEFHWSMELANHLAADKDLAMHLMEERLR